MNISHLPKKCANFVSLQKLDLGYLQYVSSWLGLGGPMVQSMHRHFYESIFVICTKRHHFRVPDV